MGEERSITIGSSLNGSILITGDSNILVFQATRFSDIEEATALALGRNPYVGLAAFTEREAARFFGRETLIHHLWEKLKNLHEPQLGEDSHVRLLAVYGPSGCGKSSLVRAGLVPELARHPFPALQSARVAVIHPGDYPLEALAAMLARIATGDETPVAKTREFRDELQRRNDVNEYDGLRRIAAVLPAITNSPLIVLVDQFEETYALCQTADEREAFIATLLHAASAPAPHVTVILVLRSDFLSETQRHPQLNQAIAKTGILVPALSEAELQQAITQPAEQAGYSLDPATVDLLISETLGREGALPLLQFALERIWDGIVGGKPPAETLREIGGVGGALAGEAQRLYESLSEENKRTARRAFLAMIQLGEGAPDTRRRVTIDSIVGSNEDAEHVLEILRGFASPGKRLVTLSSTSPGATIAEVTHEALIENWQNLREWLTESRDDLRFHRRLAEAVQHWENLGRPDGSLWRSPDLNLLQDFYQRANVDMTSLEVQFLQTSTKRERRSKQLQRILAAVLAVLVLVAGSAAFLANQQRQAAIARQNDTLRAQSLLLSTLSLQQTDSGNATNGAILALEALPDDLSRPERPLTPEALAALHRAVNHHRERGVLAGHNANVRHAVYGPDGQRVMTISEDGTVRLWDAETGRQLRILAGHTKAVRYGAFSPDGRRLLTVSADQTGRLWDVETGTTHAILQGHESEILFGEFSPDGHLIVTASAAGNALLWSAETGERLAVLNGHELAILQAAFSPDGRRLITASMDNTARLWDVEQRKEIAVLDGHKNDVLHVAFSPDGRRIVTASWDTTARLWDADNGTLLKVLRGHERGLEYAAFSPDGHRLVTASLDRSARTWDVETGEGIMILRGHERSLQYAAFSPDGRRIVTTSADYTARLWDAENGVELIVLGGHEDTVWQAAFSPDGRRLVTASADRTARLWDVESRTQWAVLHRNNNNAENFLISPDERYVVFPLENSLVLTNAENSVEQREIQCKGPITHVSFSPDGRRVVIGSKDDIACLKNVDNGDTEDEGIVLNGHTDDVLYTAFSPDGSRVLTTSADQTVRLWNAHTGAQAAELPGHKGAVWYAMFSPDGHRIVTIAEKEAALWDAERGVLLIVLNDPKDIVLYATFSADGRRIVTTSANHTAQIWDAENRAKLAVLTGHEKDVIRAAFSPDSRRIATASADHTARLWDVESAKAVLILRGHEQGLQSIDFSPDGKRLVTAAADHTARVWDAESGIAITTLRGHRSTVWRARFSGDGRRVMTTSADGTARIWDAASGIMLGLVRDETFSALHGAFSPDGSRLAITYDDGTVQLWNTESGTEKLTLHGSQSGIALAAFSPDGHRLVTASRDGTIRLWDADSGAQLMESSQKDVSNVTFNKDGRYVLIEHSSNKISLWYLGSGKVETSTVKAGHDVKAVAFGGDKLLRITVTQDNVPHLWNGENITDLPDLRGHLDPLSQFTISPNGRRLIVWLWKDRLHHLWDIENGVELSTLEKGSSFITYSPDSRLFATASPDNTLKIFDAENGIELEVLRGHERDIRHVLFSPDSRLLVTTSDDRTARLWDVESGTELMVLRGHDDAVLHAAFSPDGRYLATMGADGMVRVTTVPKFGQELLQNAWALLPRCLTAKERKQFSIAPDQKRRCPVKSQMIQALTESVKEKSLFHERGRYSLKGYDVREVQWALVSLGFNVEVDGVFGLQTANALAEFQRRNRLKADGIVGHKTRSALLSD